MILSYFSLSETYLDMKFVYLWWLEVEVWNTPILAFRIFLVAAILKMPQVRECIPKFSC